MAWCFGRVTADSPLCSFTHEMSGCVHYHLISSFSMTFLCLFSPTFHSFLFISPIAFLCCIVSFYHFPPVFLQLASLPFGFYLSYLLYLLLYLSPFPDLPSSPLLILLFSCYFFIPFPLFLACLFYCVPPCF